MKRRQCRVRQTTRSRPWTELVQRHKKEDRSFRREGIPENPEMFTVYVSAVVLAACLVAVPVSCQFPRTCMTVDGIVSKECCPELISPDGQNLGVCGENASRGSCQDLAVPDIPHNPEYPFTNVDDRERWPNKFFNRTCACQGNFWGYNCGECRYGWTGESCAQPAPPVLRKNIQNCTAEERRRFVDALDQAKRSVHPDYIICKEHWLGLLGPNGTEPQVANVTIYNLFVWMHYYAVRDTLLGPGQPFKAIDFAHEGPAYNTWHRMHLLWLEREMQKMLGDESFALHYWDWSVGGTACDVCTDDMMGARHPLNPTALSPGSPFSRWQSVCMSLDDYNRLVTLCNGTDEGPIFRNPGGNVDRPAVRVLPRREDVGKERFTFRQSKKQKALSGHSRIRSFRLDQSGRGSFRNSLEGYSDPEGTYRPDIRSLHNLAHLFLNGTGAITHASANDPIFVLLHSYSDAIFDAWLRLQNSSSLIGYPEEGAPIGHNLNNTMVPFLPVIRNADVFQLSEDLGYAYDVLPQRIPSNQPLSGIEIFGIAGRDGRGVYEPLVRDDVRTGRQYTAEGSVVYTDDQVKYEGN
ncbi:5,6-dihydroxyindole-2-carboxylic acid oxidase [Branchiostoma belcheri]|nr:5,6-dihydroxyindole-2-carboxylic acid oxidase [Branchiostoma belcheri]